MIYDHIRSPFPSTNFTHISLSLPNSNFMLFLEKCVITPSMKVLLPICACGCDHPIEQGKPTSATKKDDFPFPVTIDYQQSFG